MVLTVFLALNSGHLLAPIALAWGHNGFRQIVLAQKSKYILLPIFIAVMGTLLGATVGTTFKVNPLTFAVRTYGESDLTRPFVIMLILYFIWNTYHFIRQNYGFARLYSPRMDRVTAMELTAFATIFGMIVLPEKFHDQHVEAFFFGVVVINHQLAAIGLCAHVWGRHYNRSPMWFAATAVAVGALFAWVFLNLPAVIAITVIGLRVAIGFVHFLYDRWIWKLSDPQVRATIGKDVFRSNTARPMVGLRGE
jgi:hypothetical protein